jgi:hypothetical protein
MPIRPQWKSPKLLSKARATAILTEYDKEEGYVSAISFRILLNNQPVEFRLSCDWKPVLTLLERDQKVPRRLVNQPQAVRVAWRIVRNWRLLNTGGIP